MTWMTLTDQSTSIRPGSPAIPLSPHYGDMIERWQRVDYIPMSMRREDIDPGAIGTLVLRPQ